MKTSGFGIAASKTLLLLAIALAITLTQINAQQTGVDDLSELERVESQQMDYVKQLHTITNKYPYFSYKYNIEDGKVKSVNVTGVDYTPDVEKIKVVLLDLQSKRNQLKTRANRMGVFYAVDERARYNGGQDGLNRKLHEHLRYPSKSKDWGAEGTIYVKFVVDEEGKIPFASTTHDLNTDIEYYSNQLQQQAIAAIKKTSGDWQPGKIGGVDVSSFVVVPIVFELKKDPFTRYLY